MQPLSRTVSALLVTLALVAGNGALCAGWMPSAEARLACCAGSGACPMRQSESHGSDARHAVNQAEADRCCAASARDAAPSQVFVPGTALAVIPSAIPLVLSQMRSPDAWRTSVPLPRPHVATHLLLSVLLV